MNLDDLLDKINRRGIKSLTAAEKAFLQQESERLQHGKSPFLPEEKKPEDDDDEIAAGDEKR